ncbi:MAG: HAD domain-containing protein [Rhodoferax sp.]|uniref:HAD domain-containing protein n=1 Tax=Rhodoferax sp. TaxID=50421 RepID=UPI002632571E|nr:HAD domain-containing protein [Rhodoferax sp.]MDD2882495.1 HAD domain-containing protein [Rhodoferax sp.]
MNSNHNLVNVSRAIFLDIDGVFHPATDIESLDQSLPLDVLTKNHNLLRWAPLLAEQLRTHNDVMLFVHSNWRNRLSDKGMREVLGPLGELIAADNYNLMYCGVTDVEITEREASIAAKVQEADLAEYLIIDDNSGAFSELREHLLLCDPLAGVSDPAVQQAVAKWLAATCSCPSSNGNAPIAC